ncbi:MAG TPA: cytochrome c-type biogenesis protein [Pyrinomonadaceae bacterium]|nr:cytochrome c-type biogenesis protein [Pyrinomonadaceae bacterium]
MKSRFAFYLLILVTAALPSAAQQARPMADDPVLEARLMNLSRELRCLVCQNETLADSRADLAVDLRNEIREQMKAGKTDQEIIAFLTARYGDFVLYRPPVKATTYFLWFGPFVLLLGGLFVLFRYVKQRRQMITERPLSADQRRDVEALLRTPDTEKTR